MLSNRCVKEEKNISQICTNIPNGVDFAYINCDNKTITKGLLFCICNREYSTYQLIDLDDSQLVSRLLSNWDSSIRTFIDDVLSKNDDLQESNLILEKYDYYIQLRNRLGDDILSHIKNSLSTGNSIIANLGYINKPVSHRFSVADVVGIKVYEAIKLLRQYINDDELICMEVNNVFGI